MTPFRDLTTALRELEEHFRNTLGYARTYNPHFEILPYGLEFYISAYDTFQEKLPGEARFQHGLIHLTSESFSLIEIWEQARDLRYREYREIRALAYHATSAREDHSHLASAAGREFATRLMAPLADYAGLLEAPARTPVGDSGARLTPHPELDDEIPF